MITGAKEVGSSSGDYDWLDTVANVLDNMFNFVKPDCPPGKLGC